MGFKELAANFIGTNISSWGISGPEENNGMPMNSVRRKTWASIGSMADGTPGGSKGYPKSAKHGGGQVEIVVTTLDAAEALRARARGSSGIIPRSVILPSPRNSMPRAGATPGIRDTVTGAAISPSLDADGEEDDRWVGDGVFSVNMHHRCRPFTARVDPLELMVQLDLVPEPSKAGQVSANPCRRFTSRTRVSLDLCNAGNGTWDELAGDGLANG